MPTPTRCNSGANGVPIAECTITNDENGIPRMVHADAAKRSQDAPSHLLVAFALLPAVATLVMPDDSLGEAPLDLFPGQARPLPDVHLAKVRERAHGHAPCGRDEPRSLDSTPEIARVHGRETGGGELLGERASLRAPPLAERRIGVALKPPVAVPLGLPVTHEEERRHRSCRGRTRHHVCTLAPPWISAFATASAW